jgi:hypothetical protein
MNSLINEYIESKRYAWSPNTMRSERHRLNGVAHLLSESPEELWKGIQHLKPYSRLTLWTRVVEFTDWMIEHGHKKENPYKKWRRENAKQFKNCYVKTKPEISFDEALERIKKIKRADIRRRAIEMLCSGTRYDESGRCQEGLVSGKGSKLRTVYKPRIDGPDYTGSYQNFRRTLAEVSLRPHDLRKLFLTRCVELGVNEFELCELAGWSSISTASSYIRVNQDRLRGLVQKIHQGVDSGTVKIPKGVSNRK